MGENVAIIGASVKSHRYSYKAQQMLTDYGHSSYPVSARGQSVLGVDGYSTIADIKEPIDTVTIYINAKLHEKQFEQIAAKQPKRVIFNPGTESEQLMAQYNHLGIDAFEACTLVMLQTKQF
ncbi:MAG: CoA-binding protein [Gammaproteobacteria bacterium]|nr:CoA-binding protein [Gammaproteobacteria bacterium]